MMKYLRVYLLCLRREEPCRELAGSPGLGTRAAGWRVPIAWLLAAHLRGID